MEIMFMQVGGGMDVLPKKHNNDDIVMNNKLKTGPISSSSTLNVLDASHFGKFY